MHWLFPSLRKAKNIESSILTLQRSYSTRLPLSLPSFCVWGANTDVGKTLFSAGLAASCNSLHQTLLYLKPVQTGFPNDSDARLVAAAGNLTEQWGSHATQLLSSSSTDELNKNSNGVAKTLYAWKQPVSPHLAVRSEGRAVTDQVLLEAILSELASTRANISFLETAGGVASPSPSGSLQCDVLRALRLPALLIGDGRLGGISTTLAAYETLMLHGHTVAAIALTADPRLDNIDMIQQYIDKSTTRIVLQLPPCPKRTEKDSGQVVDAGLRQWLSENGDTFNTLLTGLVDNHKARVDELETAADKAKSVVWWPFTQHTELETQQINVIDARVGEHFTMVNSDTTGHLEQVYDGCASWWTQGVDEKAQLQLARAVGHAAARYGHVIFPQHIHQPALDLASYMVNTIGQGWASRVFYSDDGSTAVEVALKMAFRKYMIDHDILDSTDSTLHVLGLQEAYHGDTLGAMDAVAPSVFNGRLQTPWYTGRGLFLNPPTVGISQGCWRVLDDGADENTAFNTRSDVFDIESRLSSPAAESYRRHIAQAIDQFESPSDDNNSQTSRRLGACIIEPVLQGAGGMRLIDPLYQHLMITACKARKIPVIFDEVFSGLWRLGHPTAGSLLQQTPDIACYAKLLTGGIVPLSITMASEDVFEAFKGDSKALALLHGHSYTAHPIGCSAAVAALKMFEDPTVNKNLLLDTSTTRPRLKSFWGDDNNDKRLYELSLKPGIKRVISLGTVIAVELASTTTGYASSSSHAIVKRLRQQGVYCRPLGNVVYVMVTPMTDKAQCDELLSALESALAV